ncbi:hypothetical protein XBI1_770032 [Xenorhabdus bovienii str. Intermedium]|uniref:Uncharacterized protein n=1 Tax=Xenorhabdus bovienii str. Intermedium TaxID=1379677 RepID=A0A077QP07_XENBV|nr:hypothetical protein XBI1_770032 [Xenorhabdus bovienii str. Intermedium]
MHTGQPPTGLFAIQTRQSYAIDLYNKSAIITLYIHQWRTKT